PLEHNPAALGELRIGLDSLACKQQCEVLSTLWNALCRVLDSLGLRLHRGESVGHLRDLCLSGFLCSREPLWNLGALGLYVDAGQLRPRLPPLLPFPTPPTRRT